MRMTLCLTLTKGLIQWLPLPWKLSLSEVDADRKKTKWDVQYYRDNSQRSLSSKNWEKKRSKSKEGVEYKFIPLERAIFFFFFLFLLWYNTNYAGRKCIHFFPLLAWLFRLHRECSGNGKGWILFSVIL